MTKTKTGNWLPLIRAKIVRRRHPLEEGILSNVHLSLPHSNVPGLLQPQMKTGRAQWMMVAKLWKWLAGREVSPMPATLQDKEATQKPLLALLPLTMSSSARNTPTTMLLLPPLHLKNQPAHLRFPSDGSQPTLCHLLLSPMMTELWLLAPTLLPLL